jgi:putative transcription antitermination factor YqgF
MHLLGLDYGTKHLGVSLAIGSLAEPLLTVPTNQAIPKIQQLISEYQIDKIIVGISENRMAELTKEFVMILSLQLPIPIITHDETLTSKEAQTHLLHKKPRSRKTDHHYASALMLQDYLDQLTINKAQ